MLRKMTLEKNIPLAPFTTLGVGGPARYLCRAGDEAAAGEALDWARARQLPIWVLGGGSNVVIADAGLPGLTLMPAMRGRQVLQDAAEALELVVGAAESWDQLAAWTAERELSGMECLSGIPGSAGATPVQNVGAYGQEIAETLVSLRALEMATGRRVEFRREECAFAYRRSRFNGPDAGRFLITQTRWRLSRRPAPLRYAELRAKLGERASPAEIRAAVLAIRRGKGMVIEPGDPERRTAGSFFKNPVVSEAEYEAVAERAGARPPRFAVEAAGAPAGAAVKLPAAWLIERSGLGKGYRRGRVGISSRHALALVNYGDATAAELLQLAGEITARVRDRLGVELRMEPVRMGFENELGEGSGAT